MGAKEKSRVRFKKKTILISVIIILVLILFVYFHFRVMQDRLNELKKNQEACLNLSEGDWCMFVSRGKNLNGSCEFFKGDDLICMSEEFILQGNRP